MSGESANPLLIRMNLLMSEGIPTATFLATATIISSLRETPTKI